jgi:hypothetical protein
MAPAAAAIALLAAGCTTSASGPSCIQWDFLDADTGHQIDDTWQM